MPIQPALTKLHEGFRSRVYLDSRGIKTIGWGLNLEAPGAKVICDHFGLDYQALCDGSAELNQVHAGAIFDWQLDGVRTTAGLIFKDFAQFPENARAVVEDLIFNLGTTGFLKFKKTIAAMKVRDWNTAADELTDSLWAHQVGRRAKDDIALLRAI